MPMNFHMAIVTEVRIGNKMNLFLVKLKSSAASHIISLNTYTLRGENDF